MKFVSRIYGTQISAFIGEESAEKLQKLAKKVFLTKHVEQSKPRFRADSKWRPKL